MWPEPSGEAAAETAAAQEAKAEAAADAAAAAAPAAAAEAVGNDDAMCDSGDDPLCDSGDDPLCNPVPQAAHAAGQQLTSNPILKLEPGLSSSRAVHAPHRSNTGIVLTGVHSRWGGPRLVLLGTTGSGKSTIGNYLLGTSHDVFRVQHSINSCTHDIQVATSVPNGLCVVDTPGMGDVPVRQYGQSDEAYDNECRPRRVDFLTQVTGQLRDHGGVVLYVLENGRLTPEKQRHLKAVNLLLHRCFTSSVVLLLTNVPDMADIEERMKLCDMATMRDMLADPRHLAAAKYMQWLSEARAEVERCCALRFAAVLGACRPSAASDHPAHPRHLLEQMRSLLSDGGGRQPLVGLFPGVAMSWTDIVEGHWTKAKFSETQNKAIHQTRISCNSTDANLKWLSQQIEVCKATPLMARVGMVAGVAGGAAAAFLGPLAAVGPAAGATAAGTVAIFQMCYKTAEGEAVKTLDRLREDLRQQRAELGQLEGQTPKQLKRRAEEIERLVYG